MNTLTPKKTSCDSRRVKAPLLVGLAFITVSDTVVSSISCSTSEMNQFTFVSKQVDSQ